MCIRDSVYVPFQLFVCLSVIFAAGTVLLVLFVGAPNGILPDSPEVHLTTVARGITTESRRNYLYFPGCVSEPNSLKQLKSNQFLRAWIFSFRHCASAKSNVVNTLV